MHGLAYRYQGVLPQYWMISNPNHRNSGSCLNPPNGYDIDIPDVNVATNNVSRTQLAGNAQAKPHHN